MPIITALEQDLASGSIQYLSKRLIESAASAQHLDLWPVFGVTVEEELPMSVRAVQLAHPTEGRRVAIVSGCGKWLVFAGEFTSLYSAARHAIEAGLRLEETLREAAVGFNKIAFDDVYTSQSEWKLLPAFDHPLDPAHCLVTGTGLTHRKSADNRNSMHSGAAAGHVTDSMQMYLWGEQGGRPDAGTVGTAPEWFYKGDGSILRAHGEPLTVPDYAEDGGEEAELAGLYIVANDGNVYRIGFAASNEFSDHVKESHNYLYLAPSKLRECSVGPEAVIAGEFETVSGKASIVRNGETIWSLDIASGGDAMTHTLQNMEHHHFKYAAFRRPGDAHIYFFGTPGFSFGSGVSMQDGDEMHVQFEGYGRPLVNPISIATGPEKLVTVKAL